MLKGKRILIAAGGTGGHINPALGTAGYIKEKDPDAENYRYQRILPQLFARGDKA